MKPVDVVGITVDVASGAPAAVLRETDAPHRILPIFIGETEAASIVIALSETEVPRPLTHDLMTSLLEQLGAHVDAVAVTAVRDGAFFAELEVSSAHGTLRIDTRPSDGIALAVRSGAQVFVDEEVLDAAGMIAFASASDEQIDAEVAEFRGQLSRIATLDDADDV